MVLFLKTFVIDDFLKDPYGERERALAASYDTITHRDITYRGISLTKDPESEARIAQFLGFKDGQWEVFWRRYLENEENETYIHNDVLIGQYTGILFLSKPEDCKGGLAFWKHKLYGWAAHPPMQEVAARGLKDTQELWDSVFQDGFDESKWEMIDYVPMYFNRLVLFWSPRFHSRYPKKAFGTEIGNARLIKTFFVFPHVVSP